jgi:hypothetical protein
MQAFSRHLKEVYMIKFLLSSDYKRLDIQPIKMIKEFEKEFDIEDNILYLTLNEDFLFLFLHTEKYFMKVDLNIPFKMSSYKSKNYIDLSKIIHNLT